MGRRGRGWPCAAWATPVPR
ncbi:hypothetical protein E2C01_055963 [Portunus trituberculatus]|uniref:Uncharacterized protein n=1 Tax=Portunus trituberculatus TaxID=210409 RepID=A0A5B7GW44_PORTR|nr:hypothetical protein [Portunus trituberculatus]